MESCFKTYDIRGVVPDQLDEALAERVGLAFCRVAEVRSVVVGRDVRPSSPALSRALIRGLTAGGADVVDIGLCGTEEMYHATFAEGFDGGVMVTASHNPERYNGMKFVGRDALPLNPAEEFRELRRLALSDADLRADRPGRARTGSFREAYLDTLLRCIDPAALKGLRILVNGGNGCAGPVLDALERRLPCGFVKLYNEPDGAFPNGVPNPLLEENRAATSRAVVEHGCDVGVAFDGDFDRCFLFDERGRFVEGYYIVGMLAEMILAKRPGATIIYDPRLTWNTLDVVQRCGGVPALSRTGHVFIKRKMRELGAAYGGEMSGHHYFKDFGYCDSGMLTWLLAAELLGRRGCGLAALVGDAMARYPVSGEINRRLDDPDGALDRVRARFEAEAASVSRVDGLSLTFPDWRFNVRRSSTEPLVRLNVESRGDPGLVRDKTREILELLQGE